MILLILKLSLAPGLVGAATLAGRRWGGTVSGWLVGFPVVAGPIKARLIRDHAAERGHDLDECFAFSDSYSDVPMLSVVGNPAVVNPDRRLRLLAKAYSWPTFNLSQSL